MYFYTPEKKSGARAMPLNNGMPLTMRESRKDSRALEFWKKHKDTVMALAAARKAMGVIVTD